jgi:putative ABC transport system permease protein
VKRAGALTFLVRETRGAKGRAGFLVLCVAVGVAAVVTVSSLSEAVRGQLRSQSRELMAADLSIEARRPLPTELAELLPELAPGAERTNLRELATMVASAPPETAAGDTAIPAKSRLAELKVVDGRYPLHGELLLDPPTALDEVLIPTAVVCAPELLTSLDLNLGDELLLGGARFTVAAMVLDEPDRLELGLVLGPRIFVSRAGLERTELLGVGNRVKYKTLIALPGNPDRRTLERLEDRLERELPGAETLRVRTHFESQPGVRRGLERFTRYLGLVALLSLVLGGVGVGQVVRTWLGSRTREVAVLRSLGLVPGEILSLMLAQVLLLALAGSLLGALAGGAAPILLGSVAPELFPAGAANGWPLAAVLRGLALGMGVATLFALPALTSVWRVSPALVLRADAVPLAAPAAVRWTTTLLLIAGLLLSAWWQAGDFELAAGFTAGLAAVGLVLWLGAQGLLYGIARMPRSRLSPTLTNALAALVRPGAGTVGAVVALGLGTLVVTTLTLVETGLAERLDDALPEDAPSVFLVDVQPDQWTGVEAELESAGALSVDSLPVVMARIAVLNGTTVDDLLAGKAEPGTGRTSRWRLTREQRLTWFDELPDSNRMVEGELWGDPAKNEASLEVEYAKGLGLGIGSTITFDVQGVPLEFLVTSLREIEWESFAINFFVAVEPGALEGAPGMRLAAARLAPEAEDGLQNRLVAAYPNVTMLRVRPILEKVGALLERIASGVRLLGGFAVIAGLAILAGTVASANLRRGREVALWKTLGLTRGGILRLFLVEFAVVGLLAGGLGALGAYAFSWGFLNLVIDLAGAPSVPLAIAGGLVGMVLALVAGIAASAGALAAPPVQVLREE